MTDCTLRSPERIMRIVRMHLRIQSKYESDIFMPCERSRVRRGCVDVSHVESIYVKTHRIISLCPHHLSARNRPISRYYRGAGKHGCWMSRYSRGVWKSTVVWAGKKRGLEGVKYLDTVSVRNISHDRNRPGDIESIERVVVHLRTGPLAGR